MGYRTRHVRDVPYSGSVRVHYPASEHGGSMTVGYSGSVPVGITVNVDTDPFDRSIDDTNTSLGVVAGAVAATEAAQVAEIAQAGERISQAAVNGFYRVIVSEMSAQVSEFGSVMRSCVGLLVEEGEQVGRIHRQMDSDYHAIKARYLRIFSELDRELDRRTHELDRPAFQIRDHMGHDVVTKPYATSVGKTVTHDRDISSTALKLACARAKQRVSASLESLGSMCDYVREYHARMDDVMSGEAAEGVILRPVVYTLQQDLDSQLSRIVVHTGEGEGDLGQDVTTGVIRLVASTPDDEWSMPTPSDRQAVDDAFMSLVGDYRSAQGDAASPRTDERVRQTMVDLYRQSQPTCLYADEG